MFMFHMSTANVKGSLLLYYMYCHIASMNLVGMEKDSAWLAEKIRRGFDQDIRGGKLPVSMNVGVSFVLRSM